MSFENLQRCRFSTELSSRTAVTSADVRCLIVLSRRLSQRSVIFFRNRRRPAGEGSFLGVRRCAGNGQSCLEAANGTAFVSCSSTLSAMMPTTLRSSGPSSISTPPALARVSDRTPGGARIGRRRPAATDRAQVLQPAGHPVQLRDYEHVASAQMPEAVSNCGRRSKGPRGLVHVGVPRLEGSDCPNAVAVNSCCSVSVIFVQSA
jgi:hypothetical protein